MQAKTPAFTVDIILIREKEEELGSSKHVVELIRIYDQFVSMTRTESTYICTLEYSFNLIRYYTSQYLIRLRLDESIFSADITDKQSRRISCMIRRNEIGQSTDVERLIALYTSEEHVYRKREKIGKINIAHSI